jgi:ferric-dicitrate binding protein FerR (iron transport regulator)
MEGGRDQSGGETRPDTGRPPTDEQPQFFGRHPTLPPRPPVPDDKVHGDEVPGTGRPAMPPPHAPTPVELQDPDPDYPVRRRRRGVAWLAIAALGAGGIATAANAGSMFRSESVRGSVTGDVRALIVTTSSGDVDVRADGEAGVVQVERRFSGGPAERLPAVDAGSLELGNACRQGGAGCDTDYTVTVPIGTAVTVRTAAGDVEVRGQTGAVSVKTTSGDVTGNSLSAASADITTTSGEVELDTRSASSQLKVDTTSGDVDVTVPQDVPYRVRLESTSGDYDQGILDVPSSPRLLSVTTTSGDITLEQ